MPTYPSSYSNNAPYNAGPQSNINLLYKVRDQLLRHNVIPITRIINNPIILTDYLTAADWRVGRMQDWVYGLTVTSGSNLGLADGDLVAITNQSNQKRNGIFKYVQGAAGAGYAKQLFTGLPATLSTGSTGPALIRIATLYSGSAFPGSYEFAATSYTAAQTYLNQLWNPSGRFGVTGSLAQGPSGRTMFLDIAGNSYPAAFYALSGSPTDTPQASPASNVGKVVYFTQLDTITLGTTFVQVSSPQSFAALGGNLPSSRTDAGTERLYYSTDTIGLFFRSADSLSNLLTNITNFIDGGSGAEVALSPNKKAYLANLDHRVLTQMRQKFDMLLPDLYQFYYNLWNLQYVYLGTTGPKYPSSYNAGYQVYNSGNY